MTNKAHLRVLKTDTLPWEDRAARVLGVESLPPLPTPHDEEFHATNLRPLTALKPHRDSDWELAEVARALPVVQGPQVVMVNGRMVPQLTLLTGLSRHVGVQWEGLHPGPETPTPLSQWHAAQGGHVVEIKATGPGSLTLIHLLAGDDTPTGGTVKITVAEGADFTLTEHMVGQPTSHGWWNDRLLANVGESATFRHQVLQTLPLSACWTRRNDLTLTANATYQGFQLAAGAQLARVEHHITTGKNCHVTSNGLALTDTQQTHDTTLRLTHTDEATQSHVRQRNILRGETAHAVFQGKFYVAQKAQKTDAYMLAETLLLAEGARVSAKPELEIYADDVKCSHGASTGSLSPDQLFYLAARGVPESEARRLLVAAFADELLSDITNPAFPHVVNAWLDGQPITPAPADESEPETDWLQ